MYSDNVVLCAASAYEEKFYLDENFNALPDSVKDELKIMCVLYTQDVGGILVLEFDEDGNLQFRTEASEQEVAVETLMASKGFSESVVSLTADSADIVVNAAELTDANRAQIEDIVTRKTNIAPEKIVITPIHETAEAEK